MKYRLEAEVEGLLRLQKGDLVLSANVGDAVYELRSDGSGKLTLSVTLPVPAGLNVNLNLQIDHWLEGSQVRSSARFNHYPELVDVGRRHLQEIESALAFFPRHWPLRRIRWDVTRLTYIRNDETAPDSRDLTIEIRPTFHRHSVTINQEEFRRAAQLPERYPDLIVPIAFWREGVNAVERGDHLQAFYSLYFVAEGLFANGRSGEKEVIKAFRASDVLRTACEQSLEELKKNDPTDAELLSSAIAGVGGSLDTDGLQRFLIRTRGGLHHFFSTQQPPHRQSVQTGRALVASHLHGRPDDSHYSA